jgi:hypothetical protein
MALCASALAEHVAIRRRKRRRGRGRARKARRSSVCASETQDTHKKAAAFQARRDALGRTTRSKGARQEVSDSSKER